MTEAQAQQIIELLERVASSQNRLTEAITTLAQGLNANLESLTSTVDDIEEGVGALVNATDTEATI